MVATGDKVGMEATRDKEHGTPEHDKLMYFIAKKENYRKLVQAHMQEDIPMYKFEDFNISISLEEPIYQNNKFLVGVADAVIRINYKTDKETFTWLVELKPKIQSVGEVIRQMKLYNETLKAGLMFLITSEEISKETDDLLHEQGILAYSINDFAFFDGFIQEIIQEQEKLCPVCGKPNNQKSYPYCSLSCRFKA